MTRITNFGRKKTYMETGGSTSVDAAEPQQQVETDAGDGLNPDGASEKPLRRSRRRPKKANAASGEDRADAKDAQGSDSPDDRVSKKTAKSGEKRKREESHARAAASERRRLRRVAERQANMTCLACRKKGHVVKDCPDAPDPRVQVFDPDVARLYARIPVRICYRCGSRNHRLWQCKHPASASLILPYASCFLCYATGHLASVCPKHKGNKVYPHGGWCELCGETDHLAKDCKLGESVVASGSAAVMLGNNAGVEGGADEDDFHVLKRRQDALQKAEVSLRRIWDKPVEAVPKVVIFE